MCIRDRPEGVWTRFFSVQRTIDIIHTATPRQWILTVSYTHLYTSGGMDVIMKDNLCWLADGKSIAGSVLTLAQGVKNIVDWGIASADIAIRMATEVPARSAHIEDKCGSIMPGRDADFVVFDHELTLVETYVGGQSVGNAFTE